MIVALLFGTNLFIVAIITLVGMICMHVDGKQTLQQASHCPECFIEGELNEFNPVSKQLHLDCQNCKVSWNLEMPKNFFRSTDGGGGDCD